MHTRVLERLVRTNALPRRARPPALLGASSLQGLAASMCGHTMHAPGWGDHSAGRFSLSSASRALCCA